MPSATVFGENGAAFPWEEGAPAVHPVKGGRRVITPIRMVRIPKQVPQTCQASVIGMPHNFAFDEINHFFGDVGGVIADAFKVP